MNFTKQQNLNVSIVSHCLTFSMLWMTCCHITSSYCMLRATYVAPPYAICVCYLTYITRKLSVQILRVDCTESQQNFEWCQQISKWEWGLHKQRFDQHVRSFCEVCMTFLVKFRSYYGQFSCKYNWAYIWDGIVYHFANFRFFFFMVESRVFNHEISVGKMTQVHHCHLQWLILVGFSESK